MARRAAQHRDILDDFGGRPWTDTAAPKSLPDFDFPAWEDPAAVNALVAAFLNRLDAMR
ncbi:MAG: hypothetical protein VW405_09690 [Rhodospirillaceae bacterium]